MNKKSGSISKYKMKLFPIPLNPPLKTTTVFQKNLDFKGGRALNKAG
jgi:hypothetical protein